MINRNMYFESNIHIVIIQFKKKPAISIIMFLMIFNEKLLFEISS